MSDPTPLYVPIPSMIALAKDSDLIGHYNGLKALAWQADFDHTPPLLAEQLWQFIGLKRARFYTLLKQLEDLGWVRHDVPRPGYLQIYFTPATELPAESSLIDSSKLSLNMKENGFALENLTKESLENWTKTEFGNLVRVLVNAGIHEDIARFFARSKKAETIYEAIEIFEWARANGRASAAGYLGGMLRDGWKEPRGYIPPGWLCSACSRRKDDHASNCPAGLNAWLDEPDSAPARVALDEICKTCGQTKPNHDQNCWRGIILGVKVYE